MTSGKQPVVILDPPVRLGKRGKPTQQDWRSFWKAHCESITTKANDRVKRRKEQRKVLGALKASLRTGDLVAAGHYQRIVDEFFCADVNAADLAVVSESETEGAAAGRPDSNTLVAEECGAAGDDNAGGDTRRSASSSQSENEPETHHGTQIDAHADSQVTKIDGEASQSSDDGAASGVSKPALDFNTVFRSS